MRSLFVILLLWASSVLADTPEFGKSAVILGLQYGQGLWALDRGALTSQAGTENANTFLAEAQNSQAVGLRIGYNILGHATIAADILGTGWNLTSTSRGGGGFVSGVVAWHPMQLAFLNKPRTLPIDANVFLGLGWGIAGQSRGMDGMVLQAGFNVEYYLTKAVGLGFFSRGSFLKWDKFYLNYDRRDEPGNTIKLPEGSGGTFWTLGLALTFRFVTE